MREKTQPFGEGGDRGLAPLARDASREDNGGKGRRPRRSLTVFKAVVLLVLVAVAAYGMFNGGLYSGTLLPRPVAETLGLVDRNPSFADLWLPVAAFILGLLFVTLFARGFYRDLPRVGVVLVALLAALAAIKGVSMLWTISETETVKELVRSSAYAATFLLALGAVASRRQVGPLVDIAVLMVAGVAGYGLVQKISPVEYKITSVDNVTIDSTLGYSNTVAMVLGIGVVLALARMTATRGGASRASRGALLRDVALRGLYAALVLAFFAALAFTISRGGFGSLLVGLVVLFALAGDRLQMFANLVLVGGPVAWLYWRIRDLDALLPQGIEAPDAQKVADGTALRNYLIVALVAAFVLQAVYAFVAARFELTPGARRALGALAVAGTVLAVGAGAFLVAGELDGGQDAGVQDNGGGRAEQASQSLFSLSVGFREEYWKVAWDAWMERPLTGTGAGTFHYTWLEDRSGTQGVRQVHNLYLEQGTETGVFAFLVIVGFAAVLVWCTARAAWRSGARDPLGERRLLLAGLASALVIYLVSSVFEWHWYVPGSTLFFFVLAGVAVKYASMEDAGEVLPENGR